MINFKDFKNINNIQALIESIKIPEIPDSTNFWLIRTESGVFYDEYINNDFVALGWNDILPGNILEAKKNKHSKDAMLEYIAKKYDTKQPGMIFNKCDKFINEVKEKDIFMIPDKSNNEITFAVADIYYEETNLSTTEAEFIAFKESGWMGTFEDKDCPYIKRHKIKILKRIPGEYINPNLFKALISYHGLSDINNHADDILSSVYPIYIHNNKLNTVFRIKADDKIDALAYSSLIYNSTKQINPTGELGDVSVKSNVNSPGSIILSLFLKGRDTIATVLPYLILIWICLGGGKILGVIEINSIIKNISDALTDKENRKKIKAETRATEIKNESNEIDLEIKRNHYDSIKNMDPDLLKEISKTAEPLDIDISEITEIINLEEYKKNRDNN